MRHTSKQDGARIRNLSKSPASNEQAQAFIHTLHETGWRHLNQWNDSGHTFELFAKNGRTVIVQIYPGGHGFEVWRPVTTDNSVLETRTAVEAYGEGQ